MNGIFANLLFIFENDWCTGVVPHRILLPHNPRGLLECIVSLQNAYEDSAPQELKPYS
jgi:hypothetical protein